jgi:BASS family bile acid:Na+ symporter
MPALAPLAKALAWLGRQGTLAIAAVVFVGIAVPPLGRLFKPVVTEAIFVLLVIAFVRVDLIALRNHLQRPLAVLAVTVWTMLVVPAIVGLACMATGIGARSDELLLALMLQAIAPPMMAAPAFAALMGLDATLVVVAMVACAALSPFTAMLFAYLFIGPTLALSPVALGIKLFLLLAGSVAAAVVIRRIAGAAAIARHKDELDGFNIIMVFVFVAALMESVAPKFAAAPVVTLGLLLLAFAMSYVVLALTALLFAWTGGDRALVLALMTSQRNMGLMLAATGGALPDFVWLYFALSQFPIYLAPQLLKPLARRLLARARHA